MSDNPTSKSPIEINGLGEFGIIMTGVVVWIVIHGTVTGQRQMKHGDSDDSVGSGFKGGIGQYVA